jgi:hypothetical protein
MGSFPDTLVMAVRRYVVDDKWQPVKLGARARARGGLGLERGGG